MKVFKKEAVKIFRKHYNEICNIVPVKNGMERAKRFTDLKPIAKKLAKHELIACHQIAMKSNVKTIIFEIQCGEPIEVEMLTAEFLDNVYKELEKL
jgi:hypothetical protein